MSKESTELISSNIASEIVLSNAKSFGEENIALEKSIGRVLAEDIFADRDFPPFDRVTMDGICIHRSDFESGRREFEIIGIQAAGDNTEFQIGVGQCIEIMTGAALVSLEIENDLIVVRYEDVVLLGNGQARVNLTELPVKNNVHKRGEDKLQGDLLIKMNKIIAATDISIMATVGHKDVLVYSQAKIVVVSTGNELVGIDEIPAPHQIRKSNSYGISAFLHAWSSDVSHIHISDNRKKISEKLSSIMESYDIVIISGGISKGKYDFIPDVLEDLGVDMLFHGVKQRPGKPFWFGINEDTTVFALPGNPVSAMAGTIRYIIPFIRKSMSLKPLETSSVVLNNDIEFKPKLTRFLEAYVSSDDNAVLKAEPLFANGSGDFTRLVNANAFLILPAEQSCFCKGDVVSCIFY